jgi:predicted DsbA family dithiol-disulfide isomerase
MLIDVFFDPICPWCFIGKRRLEAALALRPRARAEVSWRPFLLNPEMPMNGIERTAYLVRKFGSEARVRRIYGAIAEAGQSVEIDFRFGGISRTPNTVGAHRLIRFAEREGKGGLAVEALFRAYFLDGLDIGKSGALLGIGEALGFASAALGGYLKSGNYVQWVHRENAAAHRLGINGVPSYVFQGRQDGRNQQNGLILSGAQDAKVIARLIDAALAAA